MRFLTLVAYFQRPFSLGSPYACTNGTLNPHRHNGIAIHELRLLQRPNCEACSRISTLIKFNESYVSNSLVDDCSFSADGTEDVSAGETR